jgi:hypothetical protein
MATSRNLSPETTDRMHFAKVMICNDSIKSLHAAR